MSKLAIDIRRKQDNYVLVNKFFNRVVKIYLQHGTLAVACYRFGEWCYRANIILSLLCRPLFWVSHALVQFGTGVYINPRQAIGSGFVIHNFSDVCVDAHSIGENLTINQGVYIGRGWQGNGKPKLGDNVFVGAGAKIVGDISVGDGAVIAANALVNRDIAQNSLVAGVPGLILKTNDSADYVGNVAAHDR